MSGIASTATRPTPRPGGGGSAQPLTSGARRGDLVFSGAVRAAAIFLLLLMGAIAGFLIYRASSALSDNTANVLTYTGTWAPDDTPPKFGIGALAWGTLVTSLIAIVIAAPVAVGVALFITQYAPRRLSQVLGYIIDLLAAVPSIIYGLWGSRCCSPTRGTCRISSTARWAGSRSSRTSGSHRAPSSSPVWYSPS